MSFKDWWLFVYLCIMLEWRGEEKGVKRVVKYFFRVLIFQNDRILQNNEARAFSRKTG